MVTAIVLRLRFVALQPGDAPTGTRRGGVFTGADVVEVPVGNFVPEANGWYTFWPLGREQNRDAFVFAKRVAQAGAEQAWLWALPSDPEVDSPALRTVYDALLALFPGRVWSLAELAADNGPVATAIKGAWFDERPRKFRQTGVDGDGNPVLVDDGIDTSLDLVGVYRGIGTARELTAARTGRVAE